MHVHIFIICEGKTTLLFVIIEKLCSNGVSSSHKTGFHCSEFLPQGPVGRHLVVTEDRNSQSIKGSNSHEKLLGSYKADPPRI